MMFLLRHQRSLFLIACTVLFLLLATRLWVIRPLFLERNVRASLRPAVERLAEDRGWLLSDLSLASIDDRTVFLMHRMHHRGAGPPVWFCFRLVPEDSLLLPCPGA